MGFAQAAVAALAEVGVEAWEQVAVEDAAEAVAVALAEVGAEAWEQAVVLA
jgi:hypothetical protein